MALWSFWWVFPLWALAVFQLMSSAGSSSEERTVAELWLTTTFLSSYGIRSYMGMGGRRSREAAEWPSGMFVLRTKQPFLMSLSGSWQYLWKCCRDPQMSSLGPLSQITLTVSLKPQEALRLRGVSMERTCAWIKLVSKKELMEWRREERRSSRPFLGKKHYRRQLHVTHSTISEGWMWSHGHALWKTGTLKRSLK